MHAKTFAIAAAVLLVLAGGAFLMLSGPGRPTDEDAFPLNAETVETPATGDRETDSSASVAPVETRAYTGQEEWDLDQEPAATEDNLRFALVVNREGQPVVGIEVALVPMARGGGRGWPGSDGRSPTPYRKVKTGKDGFALLSPLPARRFRIEAVADGLFGATDFDQTEEPDPEDEDLPPGA
ncbi:MAG TPA: hypothetical protein PKA37_14135, partial [Planctomycetota bacterium]|nr:hypothetical protein [Planctomycetota bacterium]